MSPGLPIMHQSWGTLLSMHWPVPAASLRPLIIDTFDVGREAGISAAAPLSERVARAELQYVRTPRRDARGVVLLPGRQQPRRRLGARAAFHLSYFTARMSLERRDRAARRVRRCLDGGRRVAASRAGLARPLPHRTRRCWKRTGCLPRRVTRSCTSRASPWSSRSGPWQGCDRPPRGFRRCEVCASPRRVRQERGKREMARGAPPRNRWSSRGR